MRFSRNELYHDTDKTLFVIWWPVKGGFWESEAFDGLNEKNRMLEILLKCPTSYMEAYPLYDCVINMPGVYDQYIGCIISPSTKYDNPEDYVLRNNGETLYKASCLKYDNQLALKYLTFA